MAEVTRVKNSGRKILPQSDVRVGRTRVTSIIDSTSLCINYCNIRGIRSNINAVHQHLEQVKPEILFLSETQVSAESTDSPDLQYPKYYLHCNFRFKGGVCAFVKSNIACKRILSVENTKYDVIWLKHSGTKSVKFYCCIYRSPNDANFQDFFDYLSLKVDYLLSRFPCCDISILGDFNVHNSKWLQFSSTTNPAGLSAEAFAAAHDLTQMISEPTRIPDNPKHTPHLLDLFLTTNPLLYKTKVCSPLGQSDHCLIEITSEAQLSSVSRKTSRTLWCFKSANWNELRDFYATFPWREYCFKSSSSSDIALLVSEVILMGMELHIPKKQNRIGHCRSQPWFNKACADAVSLKNKSHGIWKSKKTVENHAHYISARNTCKTIINTTKKSFEQRKCNELASCPSGSRKFWSLAKTIGKNFNTSSFPPMSSLDGSVVSDSVEKANLFADIFASNSCLNDSGKVLPPIQSTQFAMKPIHFRHKLLKSIISKLDSNKATGPDGIPAIVLKKCSPELVPVLSKLYSISFFLESFLPRGNCKRTAHSQKKR